MHFYWTVSNLYPSILATTCNFVTDEKSNGKVVSFMKSTLQKVIFKHEVRYSYIRIDFQEDNELHPPYLANPEAEIAILTRKARIVLLRSCCECV